MVGLTAKQRLPSALLPEDFGLQLVLTDLPGAMQRMPLEDLWGLLQVLLVVLRMARQRLPSEVLLVGGQPRAMQRMPSVVPEKLQE